MDPYYLEYVSNANVDDGSCTDEKIYGCTDVNYIEYWSHTLLNTGYYIVGDALQPDVNFDDGSCTTPFISGCVADAYVEYNSNANVIEQDACITIIIEGCMSDWADNYDELATSDNATCFREGCISEWADNYDK